MRTALAKLRLPIPCCACYGANDRTPASTSTHVITGLNCVNALVFNVTLDFSDYEEIPSSYASTTSEADASDRRLQIAADIVVRTWRADLRLSHRSPTFR